MGGCVSIGPQKVVPHCNGDSEVNFGSAVAERREDTSTYEANEDVSPFCSIENGKQEDSRVKNNETSVIKTQEQNALSKENKELPKLVKTSAFTFREADIILQKPVAFDVGFDDDHCKLPIKLKKLDGAPRLTTELLLQKQEIAEKYRLKELQKKTETTSKRQRDLLKAREFERTRNAQNQMSAKLLATEKTRQSHIDGIVSKQKRREQRASRVRAKAHCLDEEEEDNIVHVDETYISDDSEDPCWNDDYPKQSTSSGQEIEDDTNSVDEFFENEPQYVFHIRK